MVVRVALGWARAALKALAVETVEEAKAVEASTAELLVSQACSSHRSGSPGLRAGRNLGRASCSSRNRNHD